MRSIKTTANEIRSGKFFRRFQKAMGITCEFPIIKDGTPDKSRTVRVLDNPELKHLYKTKMIQGRLTFFDINKSEYILMTSPIRDIRNTNGEIDVITASGSIYRMVEVV